MCREFFSKPSPRSTNRPRCPQTLKQSTDTVAGTNVVDHSAETVKDAQDPVQVPLAPVTPPPSPSPPPKRATGFAAFAGTGSPFAASPFSPNAVISSPAPQTPIWAGNGSVFGARPSAVLPASQVPDTTVAASASVGSVPPIEKGAEVDASEAAPLAAVETPVKSTVTRELWHYIDYLFIYLLITARITRSYR